MKKILSIVSLVAVFALILIAIATSSIKKPDFDTAVWTPAMTLGNPETAVRHYVVYTDLMCPYCNYYAKAIMDGGEEFEQFLAEHKILYEVRLTDMLYENGVEYSRPAAEAGYCAANTNQFWDFYHEAIYRIFTDYYSKGIGNSKTATPIKDLSLDYWVKIASDAGVDSGFEDCLKSNKTQSQVTANTYKAATMASGLPYFAFGAKYTSGGFDSSWGWNVAKQMLSAGL